MQAFIQHDERDGALAAQWLSAELNSNPAARPKFAHSVHLHLKEGGDMPAGQIPALEAPEYVYTSTRRLAMGTSNLTLSHSTLYRICSAWLVPHTPKYGMTATD